MKALVLTILTFTVSVNTAAAQSLATGGEARPAEVASRAEPSKPCVAVKDVGSHAFRNILLGGVAGALISKKQYQVLDAVEYPATPGQKFHGNDLQTLQTGGTRVVILAKNYSADDLHRACR